MSVRFERQPIPRPKISRYTSPVRHNRTFLGTVSPAIHSWTVGSLSQLLRPQTTRTSRCNASRGGLIQLIPLAHGK